MTQTERIAETLQTIAAHCGCEPSDFAGQTLRRILKDADGEGGMVVAWGRFTDASLDARI